MLRDPAWTRPRRDRFACGFEERTAPPVAGTAAAGYRRRQRAGLVAGRRNAGEIHSRPDATSWRSGATVEEHDRCGPVGSCGGPPQIVKTVWRVLGGVEGASDLGWAKQTRSVHQFFRQSLPRSRRQRGRAGGLSRRLVGPKAVANRPNNCASLRRLAARSRGRSAFRRANELDGRKPSRRSRQQETAAGGVVGLVGLCCAAIFLPLPSIDVLSKRSTCADFVQFGWPCA